MKRVLVIFCCATGHRDARALDRFITYFYSDKPEAKSEMITNQVFDTSVIQSVILKIVSRVRDKHMTLVVVL